MLWVNVDARPPFTLSHYMNIEKKKVQLCPKSHFCTINIPYFKVKCDDTTSLVMYISNMTRPETICTFA